MSAPSVWLLKLWEQKPYLIHLTHQFPTTKPTGLNYVSSMHEDTQTQWTKWTNLVVWGHIRRSSSTCFHSRIHCWFPGSHIPLALGFGSPEVSTQEMVVYFSGHLKYLCFFDLMDWAETGTEKKKVCILSRFLIRSVSKSCKYLWTQSSFW